MAARFRQTSPFDGVDEGAGPLDAAIIVPLGGSSLVFLEKGTDLHVTSDSSSQVSVTEIKSFSGGDLSLSWAISAPTSRSLALFSAPAPSGFSHFGTRFCWQDGCRHSRQEPQEKGS